jgi:hypothetical protein
MTNPDFEKVWRGRRGMRSGIKACERAKCVVSTLTLVYSAIDALAALIRESQTARATRNEFLGWVNSYLLPELNIDLTAMDIYGARCGVVHTYAPTSDLSRDGRAKLVVYKWRKGHRPDDPVLAERARAATVVELEDLIEALDRAVERFERQIDADVALRARIERNIADLLCYEPWHPVAITVAA